MAGRPGEKAIRDVVCGMSVSASSAVSATYEGRKLYFCSDTCRRWFKADPQRYVRAMAAPSSVSGEAADVGRTIAYFSMEVAVDPRIPTYAGGLGILAGDTLKSFADLGIPAVGVTLLYRNGYFEQSLDDAGSQQERPAVWDPTQFARMLDPVVHVCIEGRRVAVRAWRYDVLGVSGNVVPLYLLDTDFDENASPDRDLTTTLYGGDQRYRLAQEMILGIGGVRMLRALGYASLRRFHMNEGHAAFVALELLNEPESDLNFESVRSRCVFTTHTPVPAGHDQFPYELVSRVFTEPISRETIEMLAGADRLNMTRLALNTSRYVNGVAKRHGEVTREMFDGYDIDSITNGVHARTWTSESFRALFDRYIGGWVNDPFALRYAIAIPRNDIWAAHELAKSRLINEVNGRTGQAFATNVFTIGVARRATPYKRVDLILSDPKQLAEAAASVGPIQILFAGKAHPRDEGGKQVIRRIVEAARRFDAQVTIAYLANYDVALAQLLTAGVDLWLNTPLRPLEASGTSGMKAALNGVPSFSVLDGWWVEGHAEGVTGWSIGPRPSGTTRAVQQTAEQDAQDLYLKLRALILPMFYGDRDRWTDVMRQTIAFNASFFNTHRMVQQYTTNAYV